MIFKEKDFRWFCYYCNAKITNGWHSEFLGEIHYKVTECENCKRKIHIRVNFIGSGLDDFLDS